MLQEPDQANVSKTALIGLGSNQSDEDARPPLGTIRRAIDRIAALAGPLTGKSFLYETPCYPAGAGPDYVNAAIALDTALSPREMLEMLHAIEAEFGRLRVQRWGQRTLDLDLLALGDAVLPDSATFEAWRTLPGPAQIARVPDRLILPHPRLQDRAFVLVPLADIAPGWVHPVLGLTVAQMLAALPAADVAQIRPLG